MNHAPTGKYRRGAIYRALNDPAIPYFLQAAELLAHSFRSLVLFCCRYLRLLPRINCQRADGFACCTIPCPQHVIFLAYQR